MVESSPAVTGMDRNGRHRPERIVPEGHPSSESAVTLAEILPPNHISARPNPLQRKVPSPCRSPFPVTPARRHDQIPAILFPAAYLPPFRPSLASRASVAQTLAGLEPAIPQTWNSAQLTPHCSPSPRLSSPRPDPVFLFPFSTFSPPSSVPSAISVVKFHL